MKKIRNYITGYYAGVLSKASVFMLCIILAGTAISVWGPNKTVITKNAKATLAFVPFGLVAAMKKNGVVLDAESEKEYLGLEKSLNEALEAHLKGQLTDSELETKLKDIKLGMTPDQEKSFTDLDTAFKALQAQVDQMKTMTNGPQGKGKSLKEQIREGLEKAENKLIVEKMKNGDAGTSGFKFEVKAAADMATTTTTAYTTAGTAITMSQPEFIPGLNNVARNKPFIFPLMNVKPTSSANIVYVEKYNPQGAAAWVGEGVAAPKVSFDIQVSNSRAKMVDAYIHVSSQMLDDIDYIAAAIEEELLYQIAISVDTFILQGDGTGDNLKGIKAFAPAYSLTTLTTTSPNNCDAILAAATQIVVDNFAPDIAVMNPIDFAQTKLLKGSTGYYIVNPNNQDSTWAGIRVVQSNQVPVGYIMVMDSSKTNIHPYQNFTLSYGMINDDFIKNLVVIKGVQRMHSYIKVNDINAFVYDTLANIKTAITAV